MSDLLLSRPDTRNETRAWMLAHVPRGSPDRARARRARRLGRAVARAAADARAPRATSARCRRPARGLPPGGLLLGRHRLDAGRPLGRRPAAAPGAPAPSTPRWRARRAPPSARRHGAARRVAFDFDRSFTYRPLGYDRPGEEMTVHLSPRVPVRIVEAVIDPDDRPMLQRAIELADGGRGRVSPESARRRGRRRARRDDARRGLARRVRGRPRRGHRDRGRRRRRGRRHDLRLARAVRAPGQDAAVHRRDRRRADRPRRRRLRRSLREGLGPRPRASCATRASRSTSPTRPTWPRRRARSTSPSASTPAPAVRGCSSSRPISLDGKVATAAGDSKWISGRQSRHAPTAGAPSPTPSRSGSAPRWPTIPS